MRRRGGWAGKVARGAATFALAWSSLAALAATAIDANVATQAQLEAVSGVGPGLAETILVERRKAPFKDWADFVARVKGVGAASAKRLAAAGLGVEPARLPAAAK